MSALPVLTLYEGKCYRPLHKYPERLSWPLTPRESLSPAEWACALEIPQPKPHGWMYRLLLGNWLWK